MTSILDTLPIEIIIIILGHSSFQSTIMVCLCSKKMYDFWNNPILWENKLKKDYCNNHIPPWIGLKENKTHKELYAHLKNRKTGKAKLFIIPNHIFDFTNFDGETKNAYIFSKNEINRKYIIANELTKNKLVLQLCKENDIQRGDIILAGVVDEHFYTKYMWSGSRFINIDHSAGDYAENEELTYISSEFQVIDEFPIHYWDHCIEDETIYFDLDPYIEEVHNNLELIDDSNEIYFKTTFFHFSGIQYTIIMRLRKFRGYNVIRDLLNKSKSWGRSLITLELASSNIKLMNLIESLDPETTLFVYL